MVYESAHTDVLLGEWVQTIDDDTVRPVPPPPADGFHASLKPGDAVEVWHEVGWWPVRVTTVAGLHAFDVASDAFPGLARRVGPTQLRPRWRWNGAAGGVWHQLTAATSLTRSEATKASS